MVGAQRGLTAFRELCKRPAYVAQVTQIWRAAIDRVLTNPEDYVTAEEWSRALAQLSEGSQTTLGAYHRHWR